VYDDYDRIYKLQDRALDVIFAASSIWYLTGGTALSRFYTHHRSSDDLDFFTHETLYFSEAYRLTYAALTRGVSELRSDVDAKDFKRIVIREDDLTLRLDFVNETTVRHDLPNVRGSWKIDSVRNIVSNKICTLISRDEPRDVADVLAICRRYSFPWAKVIGEAQEKAAFTPEDLVYRCRRFPVQLLDTVHPHRDIRAHQTSCFTEETVCRSPHNMTHSPDAFSSLRSCEGAGNARRYRERHALGRATQPAGGGVAAGHAAMPDTIATSTSLSRQKNRIASICSASLPSSRS
jgi:hypothetical protein